MEVAASPRLLLRGIIALERLAEANEELIRLAKDERDLGDQIANQPGPPFCPHCSTLDPRVETGAGGEGLLSEFVLVMRCLKCEQQFYGLPEGWQIAPDKNTVQGMREARRADNGQPA